ncbi:hypothetical protein GCM10010400_58260 [Streptomyces aculeolatus]|uniref:hypothetical protein n=1 Tax=Streptomyces aculeolatus TaxID=270689 RepID=UPI001CEC9350|nr:hypothetical protein [Streptomyces aculeolatus]
MTTTITPAAALQGIADAAVVDRRAVRYLEPAIAPAITPDPQHHGAHLIAFVNGLDAVHTERALNRAGWTVEPGPRRWGVVVLRTRAPKET